MQDKRSGGYRKRGPVSPDSADLSRFLRYQEILVSVRLMPREYQFPFELRHLVYFREVARQLHFRKASETLAIAQPALSRQIAQLEKALGVRLFERTRRKVELTEAGKAFAERIDAPLRNLGSLAQEMQALATARSGHIRVAFTGLAMATVLPRILRDFHKKHPGIRVELSESPTAVQLASLESGDIACGFFHPDSPTLGLNTKVLLRENNGVLLPSDHPLARRSSLHLSNLADTPFVLFPRTYNPGFYDRILAAFAAAKVTPKIAEEVWPRANGVGLVRSGLGATFMCPSEARQLPPEVAFLPLTGPAPESRLVIGWKVSSSMSAALIAFLTMAGVDKVAGK